MDNELRICTALSGLKGLIFDCDGVLLDSRGANIAFYNCFRSCLLLPKLTADQEEYVHMATFEQALHFITPPALRGCISETLGRVGDELDYYSLLGVEEGLLPFLDWLKACGVHLAMCTNRVEPMDKVLDTFGLRGYFDPIQTASNSLPKPDPDGLTQVLGKWKVEAHEVAFIGDSSVDMRAARAGGLPFWSFKNEKLDADLFVSGFPGLHTRMRLFMNEKYRLDFQGV